MGAEFAMRMGHHLGALLGAAGNRSLWDDVRIVKTPARFHKRPDARPCTFPRDTHVDDSGSALGGRILTATCNVGVVCAATEEYVE